MIEGLNDPRTLQKQAAGGRVHLIKPGVLVNDKVFHTLVPSQDATLASIAGTVTNFVSGDILYQGIPLLTRVTSIQISSGLIYGYY